LTAYVIAVSATFLAMALLMGTAALLQNRRWVRRSEYLHRRHVRHWRNY
jgi:hypothetical protein